MSKKLQVVDNEQNLNFNVKYDNLAKAKRPNIVKKAPNGKNVKYKTFYEGKQLGKTNKYYVDDEGKKYSKQELTYELDGEVVEEISQTKLFNVDEYAPLDDYLNTYIMSRFYEIYPADNGLDKDIDKQRAEASNRSQMYKLWKYLNDHNLVARGEFNTSSRGFVVSDGYIRAIKVNGNKWTLEIGMFKERKDFQHLQEGQPKEFKLPEKKKAKRIKRI